MASNACSKIIVMGYKQRNEDAHGEFGFVEFPCTINVPYNTWQIREYANLEIERKKGKSSPTSNPERE